MPDHDEIAVVIERIVAASGVGGERQREELRRELWTHFEEAGFAPEALRRFGSARDIAAALRRVHGPDPVIARPTWRTRLESVVLDLRFAVRMLRLSPYKRRLLKFVSCWSSRASMPD